MHSMSRLSLVALSLLCLLETASARGPETRPNIIFVMADDMGWGETGYRGHPVLKTPNLDDMAANGLRFERFYAGSPLCSPTRAGVLTGRSNDRTGVIHVGHALRLQEKTIAQALRAEGYATGHFGKWHLNGLKGPGVPILKDDRFSPGAFGFDTWVSVTNYFDQNPLLSRQGAITEFKGDSSDVIMDEAVKFIEKHRGGAERFFAVVWFGSPHSPSRALPEDSAAFASLGENSKNHYGELVALDRSVGLLRRRLRELQLANNTLLVFCSDNGGLPKIEPGTTGGLKGFKGSVHEGGLRVPGIIEWPMMIKKPRVVTQPVCTLDLFPTVVDVLGLSPDVMGSPVDGASITPVLFDPGASNKDRAKPIPFRLGSQAALVDNRYKLVTQNLGGEAFSLYDLSTDPDEAHDVSAEHPEIAARMKESLLRWSGSVDASLAGKDYPEGKVSPPDPEPLQWRDDPRYQPYLEAWNLRWEYNPATNPAPGGKKKRP